MRESEVEAYLVERIKELGGEVRKVKWIGRRAAPDRVVMLPYPPHTTWVELKATGKTPEEHQIREHKRMRAMGQRVLVLDSPAAIDEVFQ